MKSAINEIIQWLGVVCVIVGHTLNAIGPSAYPYNIVSFVAGTLLFLAWGFRVANLPQIAVNLVSLCILTYGVFRAFG